MPYNLHLSKTEKDVLYKKYRSCGLSPIEASIKLKDFENYLHKLVIKLINKKKSKDEIQEKFQKEFFELCQKLEM